MVISPLALLALLVSISIAINTMMLNWTDYIQSHFTQAYIICRIYAEIAI